MLFGGNAKGEKLKPFVVGGPRDIASMRWYHKSTRQPGMMKSLFRWWLTCFLNDMEKRQRPNFSDFEVG